MKGEESVLNYKIIDTADIPFMAKLYIKTLNSEPWNNKWTVETEDMNTHPPVLDCICANACVISWG